MQKIITLFQRNYETDRLVRDEVVPGAEWVIAGEGIATRKWDGACCMIREGILYKRYNLKPNGVRPESFEAAEAANEKTGITPGWVRVFGGPADQWFRAAYTNRRDYQMATRLADGTYEAVGPHFGGGAHTGVNPEAFAQDTLVRHGIEAVPDFPRAFEAIQAFFRDMSKANSIEGVVWHHPDGRMVKIKARDFGVKR